MTYSPLYEVVFTLAASFTLVWMLAAVWGLLFYRR